MSLVVEVKSAKDLPNVDKDGMSDPFCVITFKGKKQRTKYIDNDPNPTWNETLKWDMRGPLIAQDELRLQVMDHEKWGLPQFIGKASVSLSAVSQGEPQKPHSLSSGLENKRGKSIEGMVFLEVTYTPLPGFEPKKPPTTDEKTVHHTHPSHRREEDHNEGGSMLRRQKHTFPAKPIDFQIRVHIIEARKLEGDFLKPVVKVMLNQESHSTEIRRGTNSPVWDETFIMNVNSLPDNVMDMMLHIRMLNSRMMRSDCLIGGFDLDLGTIYGEPEHCFVHKWLLLAHPEDPSGQPKGFLKVTLTVLGPGDKPKPIVTTSFDQDAVDIESNLLRPSTTRLQPATLSIKIYCARQLPPADPEAFAAKRIFNPSTQPKTDRADPYCKVKYAGHMGQTHVIPYTQNPDWDHQINLGIRMPLLSDRITFTIMDSDFITSDDVMATLHLNLSQISLKEPDMVPQFGPCFINLYGSTREFSDMPNKYEHLNKGMYPGVAYRGRLMLEIETIPGQLPDRKQHEVLIRDHTRVQEILSLKPVKYKLIAGFLSASMIYPHDATVQFELSIGNHGYRVTKSDFESMSSATAPMKPIYDQNKYYFLPWLDMKPSIIIDSKWENCTYRAESINLLSRIADDLEEGVAKLDKIKRAGRFRDQMEILKTQMREVAMTTHDNIRKALDWTDGDCEAEEIQCQRFHTATDQHLKKYRNKQLLRMKEDIEDMIKHNLSTCMRGRVKENLAELKDCAGRLRDLTTDPQYCIPDVIIWMIADKKRVAYCRIPSHTIMYSRHPMRGGKMCWKVQNVFLKPPALANEDDYLKLKEKANLQVLLWFGTEGDIMRFMEGREMQGVEPAIVAERYQNEEWLAGVWRGASLLAPAWSDVYGRVELKDDTFAHLHLPERWSWRTSHWEPHLGLREIFPISSSELKRTEKIIETQQLLSEDETLNWSESFWTNMDNKPLRSKDKKKSNVKITKDNIDQEMKLFSSEWEWDGEWTQDTTTGDQEGHWEYKREEEKRWRAYYLSGDTIRQRFWERKVVHISLKGKKKKAEEKEVESIGWEYAGSVRGPFTVIQTLFKFFRRKRFTKTIDAPLTDILSCDLKTLLPRKHRRQKDMLQRYFIMRESHHYQLRAYLYEARGLYGGDRGGLSDPYAVVSMLHYSGKSSFSRKTVNPLWQETVILQCYSVHSSPSTVQTRPPAVVIEFYDYDDYDNDEYLGAAVVYPVVQLKDGYTSPPLDWHPITRYGKQAGEILFSSELIIEGLKRDPLPSKTSETPKKSSHHTSEIDHRGLPQSVEPKMQNMRIEVLCWGVRDMKFFSVSSPIVEMHLEGEKITKTLQIENVSKNPNFPGPRPFITHDMKLPVEALYAPPMSIQIVDKIFGRRSTIGNVHVKSISHHYIKAQDLTIKFKALQGQMEKHPENKQEEQINIDIDPEASEKSDFDWWTKYYRSIKARNRPKKRKKVEDEYEKKFGFFGELKVYDCELEKVFDSFTDLLRTFPIYSGKGVNAAITGNYREIQGYLKGSIRVYPIPSQPRTPKLQLPNIKVSEPTECLIRVYIIKGINLQPKDHNGKSDPYIKVKIGKNEIDDRDHHLSNTLNPVFGKVFEIPATLPRDHKLIITVMDYDRGSADDLIGRTVIDLENRMLSLHKASVGLSTFYFKQGVNAWRDQYLPKDILQRVCEVRGIKLQDSDWYSKEKVKLPIRDTPYTLQEFENKEDDPDNWKWMENSHDISASTEQRLALHILNNRDAMKKLSSVSKISVLVPEHVETRTLYNQLQPDVSQGALHMWVDIFEKNGPPIPSAVDISPRVAQKYSLRIVVWNVKDVDLQETNIITGKSMSDIYIKGWMQGLDKVQKTDVHYRSMDGEGNFNWRFIFNFDYLPSDKLMVIKKKEHFYNLDQTERHFPPLLTMQTWDNDIISPDDFIGTMNLNLQKMLKPKENAKEVTAEMVEGEEEGMEEEIDEEENADESREGSEFDEEDGEQETTDAGNARTSCFSNLLEVPQLSRARITSSLKDVRVAFNLQKEKPKPKLFDLFKQKWVKGWWPMIKVKQNEPVLTGKILMELELLTMEESQLKPTNIAREEPNAHPHLDKPYRPPDSFLWFTSPLKSLRYIVWENFKWPIIGAMLTFIVVLMVAAAIYTFPSTILRASIDNLWPKYN